MSETSPQQNNDKNSTLSADQVASYLKQHPDFFINRDSLLAEITLPHESGQAISLLERQVKILRERSIESRHTLNQLLETAKYNDQLFNVTRALILALLMDLQEKHGMALILITHDMGVVAETADRVIVQYKGRKMEEADVLSLFENPQNAYTRALLSALPENAKGDRLPTVAEFMAAEALQ